MMIYLSFTVILVTIIFLVAQYNQLVTSRNEYKNAFAQIDVQLTRRHDLIPNMLETVKGYMSYEREALEAVIAARSQATACLHQAKHQIGQPASMNNLAAAENQLSGSLNRLIALSEAYPDLKANRIMEQFAEELTSTENRVAFARQAYNDAVMFYNNAVQTFPSNLLAGLFRFQPATMLAIEIESKRAVPKVTF